MLLLPLLGYAAALAQPIDPAHSSKIEIYHVNPSTYGAAPLNMNTGDAGGDLYFDLRSVYTPSSAPTRRRGRRTTATISR